MRFLNKLKFSESGLIPAIIQDYKTLEVLTLCYMNRDALEKTFETGKIHLWRRSKQKLMMKGETSGCCQLVKEVRRDCEDNSLLFKVEQLGHGACHTGNKTCYYRKFGGDYESGNIS